jgi:hypothetical protein
MNQALLRLIISLPGFPPRLCHSGYICEGLDPHLDFTSVVQNAAGTIKVVHDNEQGIATSRILKYSIIPVLEIGVVRNAAGKGVPFVLGSNETWAICAKGSGGRIRDRESSSICLSSGMVRN